MVCYQVANNLHLVQQTVSKTETKPAPDPSVNHLFIYDCSGSMWGELDPIKRQLKTRLVDLLNENDTFSAIWFSGRGESGVLLEAEPVASLKNLKNIESKIDSGLRARGLTGFKDPLEDASKLIDRVSKINSKPFAIAFLSDGCDNQWGRAEVLKATEALGTKVQSATFVEYGYYADRPLLTAMAEKCGGSLIFAEDFNKYAPNFEAIVQRRPLVGKRIEVDIKGDPVGGFAYALVNGDLVTFALNDGKVTVPETLTELFYVAPTPVGKAKEPLSFAPSTAFYESVRAAAYAALSLYSIRMNSDVVFAFLKVIGDVSFIEGFASCFGKQKYSEFTDAVKVAVFDHKTRFAKGYDPTRIPREDAFTVLDVISLLQEDDQARVLLNHPDFVYKKIGRSRLDAESLLTPEEQAEVDRITDELKATKDPKKIKDLTLQLTAVTDAKKETLKFEEDPAPEGYVIDGLTFNEDRPNISFRVKKPGKVDLTSRIPEAFKGTKIGQVPPIFSTFVYRNFTVVKDGLVNVEKLPVSVSTSTSAKLLQEKVITEADIVRLDGMHRIVLNLRALPVINRLMVRKTSAKDFFEAKLELAQAKAAQKVYGYFVDEMLPEKKSEGYAALYGEEAATWLKEQGITEYSGFQPPKTVQAPATDHYLSKELKTSLKGLSTLPKVAEVRTKLASKKPLNAGGALMSDAVKDVEAFLASDAFTKAGDKDMVLGAWLKDRKTTSTKKCRQLMRRIAQTTFTTIVGQVWFSEFASIDENSMTIPFAGQDVACTVEMKEAEVKI